MDFIDRLGGCIRGKGKDYVCERMDMGLSVLEGMLDASLWMKQKAMESTIPSPHRRDPFEDEVESAIQESVTGIALFQSLNENCDCDFDVLCPRNQPECDIDKVAKLMENTAGIGKSERALEKFVTGKALENYILSLRT